MVHRKLERQPELWLLTSNATRILAYTSENPVDLDTELIVSAEIFGTDEAFFGTFECTLH